MNKLIRERTPLLLPSWMVPWWVYLGIGTLRQKLGRFDDLTWSYFHAARRKRRGPLTRLLYMVYRRDSGLLPFVNWLESTTVKTGSITRFSRRFLMNGLAEAHGLESLERFPTRQLLPLANRSPAVAAELKGRGQSLSPEAEAIAGMYAAHDTWLAEFSEYVRANRGSICVVGNAARMRGSCVGPQIDQHQVVIRFNCFATSVAEPVEESVLADTGKRLDVWTFSPILKMEHTERALEAKWLVMSGPDARHYVADWQFAIPMLQQGHRVLSVPLEIWRSLVTELQAPPSAGLLTLAWMIELLGDIKGLSAAGFQRGRYDAGRYHYALPNHKPSVRHNWEAERHLLRQWESQGLNFLD